MKPTLRVQELFTFVVHHCNTQRAQAVNSGGTCRYKLGSKRCAIGTMIPDALYDPWMEGSGVTTVLRDWPEVGAAISMSFGTGEELNNSDAQVLAHLQGLHDNEANWSDNGQLTPQAIDAVGKVLRKLLR